MVETNIPAPNANTEIHPSWVTGDTINLILGALFYSEAMLLVSAQSPHINQEMILSGKTPFSVEDTLNAEGAIAGDAIIPDDIEMEEEPVPTARTGETEAPEAPEAPELTDSIVTKVKDNYIFMIE